MMRAPLTERQIRAMRDMRAEGIPTTEIARVMGVSKSKVQVLTKGVVSNLKGERYRKPWEMR